MTDEIITPESYREEIEWLAECVREELDPFDDVHEAVFDAVDSHEWIIYNGYHAEIIAAAATDPDDHEWHTFVDPDSTSARDHLQAMAFAIMRADLTDEFVGRDA